MCAGSRRACDRARNAITAHRVPGSLAITRSEMELFVTDDAVDLIRKKGGVLAIDFVPPIG